MKYQEAYLGSKTEFGEYIKKMVPELFSGKLSVEGKPVSLPTDKDLEYKVKYEEDEDGGSFSVKVTWEDQEVEVDLEE